MPPRPAVPHKPVSQPNRPVKPKKVVEHRPAPAGRRGGTGGGGPVTTGVADSTPAGSVVKGATDALPIGNLGLMSAEEPMSVTGMNSSSLLALVVGAMFAASAALFAATARRLRSRRQG